MNQAGNLIWSDPDGSRAGCRPPTPRSCLDGGGKLGLLHVQPCAVVLVDRLEVIAEIGGRASCPRRQWAAAGSLNPTPEAVNIAVAPQSLNQPGLSLYGGQGRCPSLPAVLPASGLVAKVGGGVEMPTTGGPNVKPEAGAVACGRCSGRPPGLRLASMLGAAGCLGCCMQAAGYGGVQRV